MTDEIEDDVFNDSKPEEQVEQEQETEVAANEPEEEEEQGEPEPEEEQEAEPPAAEDESPEDVGIKAALKAERQKRQAVEAENKRLKESNQAGNQDDTVMRIRRETSAMLMRSLKPDYEDKAKIFMKLAEENPRLAEECNASQNPALYAYEKANEHIEYLETKKLKDSDEFKQFLELKKSGALDPAAKRKKAALSVPNLNKAANTPPKGDSSDDDVFSGAAF